MISQAAWNLVAGHMRPAGCSLPTPVLDEEILQAVATNAQL